jgi:hypothetical protein
MANSINASFPQAPLLVPKSLVGVKTPVTDPDTNGNSQVAANKITIAADMTSSALYQVGAPHSVKLKA